MRTIIVLLCIGLGSARATERLPEVYLSHFYVVLDKNTYHALQESPQVTSLASCESSQVKEGGSEHSGFYIRGHHTYMEFFGDPVPKGSHVGQIGIGLTVERSGGVKALYGQLHRTFGDQAKMETMTRELDGASVPWFTGTYLDDGTDDSNRVSSTWVMETAPGYLAALHPNTRIDRPLSREQYLSWSFKSDLLLDDVVGLTLALPPIEAAQLSRTLKAIGWQVKGRDAGFVATGPDVRVDVIATREQLGLRRVDLRLLRPPSTESVSLGSASLELDSQRGRFIFRNSE
jgi:hypothetical protein